MINFLHRLVKSGLSNFDREIQRLSRPGRCPLCDVRRLLEPSLRTPVLFDVGANTGQTCTELRRIFPTGRIHAFEPFPKAFQELQENVGSNPDSKLYQIALSDIQSSTTLFVNPASVTNSLLPNSESAERFQPPTTITKTPLEITVNVDTLDHFTAQQKIQEIHLLKTDTQGGDLKVLRGGSGLFTNSAIHAVVCEVLFVPLYKGQCEFVELFNWLTTHNMSFSSLYNVVTDEKSGAAKWGDALFVRSEITNSLNQ